MKLSSISFLAAIAGTVILTGCASQNAAPITAQDLQAHRWVLSTVDKQAIQTDPTASQAFLQFDNSMMASGNASCNNFFGKAKLDDNRLRVDKLALTVKLCPDTIMKQEQIVHGSLSAWNKLTLEDGKLTLKTAAHTLVYQAEQQPQAKQDTQAKQ